jgi:hypothetical protein
VGALVEGALGRHVRIDLLVNNAGGLTPTQDITAKGSRAVRGLKVPAAGGGGRGRHGATGPPRHGGGLRLARRLPGEPAGDYVSGAILTLDGARDNWFGSWPPGGMTDSAGQRLAEEREPRP